MTTMQAIGLAVGLLVILTRLPAVIWPERYRERLRAIVARGGPPLIRGLGGFFWIVALAIVVIVLGTLPLLESVMLVLAVFLIASGAVSVFFPEAFQNFADKVWSRMPPWGIRAGSALGVALGAWIVFMSFAG